MVRLNSLQTSTRPASLHANCRALDAFGLDIKCDDLSKMPSMLQLVASNYSKVFMMLSK